MTITEFIEARLADDERDIGTRDHEPDRASREVTAKRAMVAAVLHYESIIDGEWGDCHDEQAIAAGLCPDHLPADTPALRTIAAIWADHDDYQPQWAPQHGQSS